MPIKIADSLPARAILESENIFVMTEHRATTQDIRPLRIALLNLMPLKIVTETQILRCLSNTPIQIEVDLIQTKTYHSKNTPEDHLLTFYKTFDDIRDQKYDGFIITGAPIENMPFEEVEYWDELVRIMAVSYTHLHTAGSLTPTFVTARTVILAVRLVYAFTLSARFPSVLNEPLSASVLFWRRPPQSNCPCLLYTSRCV